MGNNTTFPPCQDYRANHRLHMVGYSVILAVGLPLNALALWVFFRALRVHSVVSVYMCNLAASDLLFTLSLPLRLSYYARHHWPYPDILCQLAGAVFQMNMYGSCIFLAFINVDRYAAIVHPLRLRHLRRPQVARLLCLGVWALILVCAVPAAWVHRPASCRYKNITLRFCFESFSDRLWQGALPALVLLAGGLGFLLPLLAVVYSSVRVFWTLGRPAATRSQRRRTTVRLLLANLVIFLLCFVPYNSVLATYGALRAEWVPGGEAVRARVRQALVVTVLLASSNCVLDPLVYYFSAEGFRNTLRGLGPAPRDAGNGTRSRLTTSEGTPGSDTIASSRELLPHRLPPGKASVLAAKDSAI
ncbi:lysophosphatidic acid receptor 5 [Ornithorhynchus anatinus]|uniref:Lysophosphatidic acid receptor 5 n=1 Tax=Ornithorhynchus anatinus TaxID=9258 RepID=A0A6I8N6G7_ORNAN|nr:lysophosphatidic acid receptor 5 [Ornithorhynchus anatinus]XP_028910049.1 lysophosphatidic acid receptor 5 [Ornithorhynchus anatinus]